MAGQYPHYPGYNPYYNVENGQSMLPHEGYIPSYQSYQSLSSEQLHSAYVEYEDPNRPSMGSQTPARGRRRSAPGVDHVKHRRTRSGCFTCRNRRVKCDETHPICERCRKGNRECIYPEPTSTSKSRSGAKSRASPPESGDSQDDLEHEATVKVEGKEREQLPPIPDEEEADVGGDRPGEETSMAFRSNPQAQQSSASASFREASSTPSLTMDKSPSPSTEGSVAGAASGSSSTHHHQQARPARRVVSRRGSRAALHKASLSSPTKSWNELPPPIRFYLDYHREHITYHHYAFKYDANDWLSTTFLEIAIRNQPLLYAVVGFAAFHHTLSKPAGRMQDFLEYYNQSIQLLRLSIERRQRHNVATLLTILQLASIEEALGDWVNLRGHQKAAHQLLTSLYTPQNVSQNETLRKAFQWYTRFDLFVGFQSGAEAVIGREWLEESYNYWATQLRDRPNDLVLKYEERFAYSRWLATDVAMLFARKNKGQISDEAFGAELGGLIQKFDSWESQLDPALVNPDHLVKDFSDAPPRDPDSVVDPYDPNFLYEGPLWTTNFLFTDFWAIHLMFKSLLALVERRLPPPEISEMAYKMTQMFEAVQMFPRSPPGSIIEAQASMAFGSLFIARDEKTIMWCRKKFAAIECAGYIYPTELQARMQEAWHTDISEWWLPDPSTCPPMIRKLREFAQECSSMPKDQTSEDLRVMKGIFSSLKLDEDGRSQGLITPTTDEGKEFDWNSASLGDLGTWSQSPGETRYSNHDT